MSDSVLHSHHFFVMGETSRLMQPNEGKDALHAKFVVVHNGGSPRIVAGHYPDFAYHADILEAWCNAHGIPCGRGDGEHLVEIHDKSWRIDGGGWMEIRPASRYIRLFGASTAYGGFSKNDIIPAIQSSELFSGFTII